MPKPQVKSLPRRVAAKAESFLQNIFIPATLGSLFYLLFLRDKESVAWKTVSLFFWLAGFFLCIGSVVVAVGMTAGLLDAISKEEREDNGWVLHTIFGSMCAVLYCFREYTKSSELELVGINLCLFIALTCWTISSVLILLSQGNEK
jgi:membrane protein required for beta-lactamase induction